MESPRTFRLAVLMKYVLQLMNMGCFFWHDFGMDRAAFCAGLCASSGPGQRSASVPLGKPLALSSCALSNLYTMLPFYHHPHSHHPAIPHSHNPAIPPSHNPTIPHLIPHSRNPTILRSHNPTVPQSHNVTIPQSHNPTFPQSHTPQWWQSSPTSETAVNFEATPTIQCAYLDSGLAVPN